MNKDLINKFWDEFNWLYERGAKGRRVWVKDDNTIGYNLDGEQDWCLCSDVFSHIGYTSHNVTGCVIADKYDKFRIAFVEGVPLQYRSADDAKWIDLTSGKPLFNQPLGNYRIKPKKWYNELTGENKILCKVWDSNDPNYDKEVYALVIEHDESIPHRQFRDVNDLTWEFAEPVEIDEIKKYIYTGDGE